MLDSDIKTFHSVEVSSAQTNGGRCGLTQVISGVVNNVWPQVPKAQRVAGAFLYRKLHTAAEDDDDGTLMSAQEYIDRPTLADDMISAFVGTPVDTQADIPNSDTGTDTQRKFGAAYIKNSLTAGNSTITVTVEHTKFASGAEAIFHAGDDIQLKDKVNPDSVSGNEETHVISTIDLVDGLDVTFTVVGTFANAYTAGDGNARCVTIIDYGDVQCSTDNYVVTTAGDGDFDFGLYPIETDNIGTVEDSLTIEATDADNFTVTGSSGTNYGIFDKTVGTEFVWTNTDKSKPGLTIPFAAFSGTWAAGDKMEADIHEAKFSTWYRREVPVDCPSLANNKVTTVTIGESDS